MAERRMFAKTIVTSDAFLDMPATTRCLYFLLAMLADDDGFVNNPNSIMRQSGATIDDMKLLIAKRFVLTFESGVVVIKHWCIHNTIQKDRYKETKYLEEKAMLVEDKKLGYSEAVLPVCIQDVSIVDTQVRLGKDSIGKVSVGKDSIEDCEDINVPTKTPRKRFVPPTVDQVSEYCLERGNYVDPQRFVDYYSSNGWMVGKNKMKDWKAAVRTWEQKDSSRPQKQPKKTKSFLDLVDDYEEEGSSNAAESDQAVLSHCIPGYGR